MNKELRKATSTRSKSHNKYCKSPSKENDALYKKQGNIIKASVCGEKA